MEDFGYQKDGESQGNLISLTKRIFLIGATLFSITCFVYVTINAYYFVYQDKESNIETIKSPEGPIKITAEDYSSSDTGIAGQINSSIYEDIFGKKRESVGQEATKVRNSPEPAALKKPTESDRRLIKEASQVVDKGPSGTSSVVMNQQANSGSAKAPIAEANQKIITYSDQAKSGVVAKDLLTKTKGEERVQYKDSAEKPAIAQAFSNKKRAIRVQIAAMNSKAAAEDYWKRLNNLYSKLFSGLRSYTEQVDLGKRGIFFRLQIGNFYNQIEAEEFCNNYVLQTKRSRADCIVVE